jgi:antitoxin (DNA-binding transcriptional repressor) of toxin-antitoxin stability system
MPKSLPVTEVVRHFSELIGRVRFYGERVILTKGGKPVAELRPTLEAARVRAGDLPAIFAQLPHLGSEEATRFAEDLEVARHVLTAPADRWAS